MGDAYLNDGFVSQPVLRLRGGGADNKRKEARKRRFANLQRDNSADLTGEGEPGCKKLRKQAPSSSIDEKAKLSSANEPEKAVGLNDRDVGKSSQRFIVFIGNLPYTANDASLRSHFAKVKPTFIRHRTNKETGKSKGFAFLEFAAYDRMKTCLKLYHHSSFDDGDSPPRKINVELTVGGGGAKSRSRKTKLQAKNWKLSEERKRRAEEEAKVESKKMEKQGVKEGKVEGTASGKAEKYGSAIERVDNGDIHPSRLSRLASA